MSSYSTSSLENNLELIYNVRESIFIVKSLKTHAITILNNENYQRLPLKENFTTIGLLPPIYPEWLGDKFFLQTHKIRFPYIVGEMANGIASSEMVIAAGKAGMLGFFGSAGLSPAIVEENIEHIQFSLPQVTFGCNLIHSPQEPELEESMVDLYLRKNVNRVSASAYMKLNTHIVHYAVKGLHLDSSGKVIRKNFIFAKISRPEVARYFMCPAPLEILNQLLNQKKISQEEAEIGRKIAIAEDITVEADSGGHTDNRPMAALLPSILTLATQLASQYHYSVPFRIGAAGGLGTPGAVASAFALGAAYILTGSINQSAVESGLSPLAKEMLLQADIADICMAPAADMFEFGVKLQVLKRGTLFGMRAAKLYELYSHYNALNEIPQVEITKVENQIMGESINSIWQKTYEFFIKRDPKQIQLAEKNPKHKMALVFRWYLGLSSHWAILGDEKRKLDFQIWCGPAMGAFNKWVANSFLEKLSARTVEQIGRNLLEGATIITRAQQLRSFGIHVPQAAFDYKPRLLQ